jgi:hypothetical protein
MSKRKRSASHRMDYNAWRARVDNARNSSYADGHNEFDIAIEVVADFNPEAKEGSQLERRWFGTFTNWLSNLNTIKKSDDGYLPMGLSKIFNIYSNCLQCANPVVSHLQRVGRSQAGDGLAICVLLSRYGSPAEDHRHVCLLGSPAKCLRWNRHPR